MSFKRSPDTGLKSRTAIAVPRIVITRPRGIGRPDWTHHHASTALALALGGVFVSVAQADPLPQFVGDTVVVTPTRFESATLPTPAHLVVITREDIERTPATSIPDLLAGVPGAAVMPLYGALGIDATVSLRGAGSGGTATSNTLVLLNGQRLNPVDSGSIDWSLIPLASIERIEVMPGSGTVLYGDRASGGVINIVTRKSTDAGYVSLGGGSHGLREAGIQAGGMLGPIDASLYFQYGESDGWRDNSDQRRYGLGGRLNFVDEDDMRVYLDFAAFDEKLGQPGGLWRTEYQTDPTRSRHPGDRSDREGFRVRPGVTVNLNSNLTFDADLAVSRDERKGYSGPTNPVEQVRDLTRDFVSFNPKFNIRYGLGGFSHHATIGYDYFRGTTDSLTSPTGNQAYTQAATQTSHAVYAQNITDLGDRLALTLGVRSQRLRQSASQSAYTTYWGGFQPAMSGRSSDTREAYEAGLSYRADGWKFTGRAGTLYRFPNTDELYGFDPLTFDPVFAFGLEPQRGTVYEVGATRTFARASLGLNLYRQDMRDEISSDPNGGNMNIDKTRRLGVELNAKLALTDTLSGDLGLAFEDAEIRGGAYAGSDLPMVPGVQASAGLTWQATERSSYSARLNHVGERRYGDDYSNLAGDLASHTRLDLLASWRVRDWQIDARVLNATDRKYAAFGGYGFNTGTFAFDTFYYPADSRTYTLAARYTFR